MAKAIPRWPSCESDNVVPIVFGFPDPELMESSERGEVSLGGCCVTGNDNGSLAEPAQLCVDKLQHFPG